MRKIIAKLGSKNINSVSMESPKSDIELEFEMNELKPNINENENVHVNTTTSNLNVGENAHEVDDVEDITSTDVDDINGYDGEGVNDDSEGSLHSQNEKDAELMYQTRKTNEKLTTKGKSTKKHPTTNSNQFID